MALPDLATIEDVVAIIQRDLTPAEQTSATRLIPMASALVRKHTRQQITETIDDVVTLNGNWTNVLVLPQRPVTSVKSVVLNGVTAPTTQWRLYQDKLYLSTGAYQPDMGVLLWGGNALWGPAGSNTGPQATGATWQGPAASIVVTYTHGYDEVPSDLSNIVAGMVAIAIASPVGVSMERVGGYQVGYSRSEGGAMGLTDADKKYLNDNYRIRTFSQDVAPLR